MYMEKNLDITKPLSSERTLIVSPLALRYIRVPLYSSFSRSRNKHGKKKIHLKPSSGRSQENEML